jgi:hypothetical protein
MKRIVIVCAVAAAVLFGGRLLLSWGTWSSCTHDGGSGFVLAFEHPWRSAVRDRLRAASARRTTDARAGALISPTAVARAW